MSVRARITGLSVALVALNIGTWIWALVAMRGQSALLGFAGLAYGLGVRHAVDADHIAAIDNVTRKFMQGTSRPVTVGFFFAMGHSTIVILGAAAMGTAAARLSHGVGWREAGGVMSTSISALFLFVIGTMNLSIFASIYKGYRRLRVQGDYSQEALDRLADQRGSLTRLVKPLLNLVSKSWHMFPLGFLFGLGFDTATEIAMFGVAASQVANGAPLHTVVVLPLLFAAGMSLIDSTDGILMLGAYEWALVKPRRKLFYNMIMTLVSVIVALLISSIEALGLIGRRLGNAGAFWKAISALNQNLNLLGFIVIAVFLVAWLISYVIYRWKASGQSIVEAGYS